VLPQSATAQFRRKRFPEDETFDVGQDTRTGVAIIEYRYVKRVAAPENANAIKNATRAAVDVRTKPICRSKGSSAVRFSKPSSKPIS
jgi:hypothetical protein